MRIYFYFLSLLITVSCAGTKEQGEDGKAIIPPPHINCPEGGDCSFEVVKNAAIKLNYSDAGDMSPEIIDGDKLVIKYHYEKTPLKDIMDSGYSEYVYLEFDPKETQLILKDKELQKVKMIFGRICFCKGAMGYFPVYEGNLFLFHRDGNVQLRTSFKVNKIPQIIKEIDENINY